MSIIKNEVFVLSEKTQKFINNEEYCALFRKKSYRSAFIIIGIVSAVIAALIIVGRNSIVLCNTNFFHIIPNDPIVINTSRGNYSGSAYSVNVESTALRDGVLTVFCDITASPGEEKLPLDKLSMVMFGSNGNSDESICFPSPDSSLIVSEAKENTVSAQLYFSVGSTYANLSDSIFCLRADTSSTDGMINILLDIDI